jgi:hypothetical protein
MHCFVGSLNILNTCNEVKNAEIQEITDSILFKKESQRFWNVFFILNVFLNVLRFYSELLICCKLIIFLDTLSIWFV